MEKIYPNVTTPGTARFLLFSQIDSGDYKYILYDPLNSKFTIYNLNHSVYLNVSIPITYVTGSSQYHIAYVSKSLFDCDPSNIEYALSFGGDGGPTSYPKKFYIYRTDGTLVQEIDSVCFLNYSDGQKYGPEYNEPIVNTPLGTKLILRSLNGSARVYSVCGRLYSLGLKNEENNTLGDAYPNPTSSFITIPYQLPENVSKGDVMIYDINGKFIKSYPVDNTFSDIKLTTSDLPNGTYLYQLKTDNGLSGAKKIIKME